MLGTVRTKEVCPKCKGKFMGEPLVCPQCLTVPRRYFLDLSWPGQGRIKIYSGKDGHPLDSYERASRLLTAIRHEIDLGGFDPKEYVKRELRSLQFDNYAAAWLSRREQEASRRDISQAYLKEIKAYIRRYFIPFFGHQSIRDLRDGHIEDFRHWLPAHLNPKTVGNILGLLHKLFNDAYRRRDILVVPIIPKVPKQEQVIKWITEEDQRRILAQIKNPIYKAFFLFLMRQGCRTGEGRALRWEKIDFKNDIVTISAGFDLDKYKEYTKERDVRYLPLHPEVREVLTKLPRALSGFVFITTKGQPISSRHVITVWRQAAKAAGLEVTCYGGTRHSFASQAINRGCDERTIGDFMGHKTPAMTKRYAKLRTETLKRVWGLSPEDVSPERPQTQNGNG